MSYSFEDYTNATSFTRDLGNPITPAYALLGLLGETGEVLDSLKFYHSLYESPDTLMGHLEDAEYHKKELRKGTSSNEALPDIEATNPEQTKKELGDVLWYLNTLALSLGFTLEEVARLNVDKLQKRHQPPVD